MYTIDAKNRPLGRVASEIANVLIGKNSVSFQKNDKSYVEDVCVLNVDEIKISEKKSGDKRIEKYTGYPGGFKYLSIDDIKAKKGMSEVLKRSVKGMLPRNKLQAGLMKKIIFK